MATTYDGRSSSSRFFSSVPSFSILIRTPDSSPQVPSANPSLSAFAATTIPVRPATSAPAWRPISPSSPEPTTTLDDVRHFLDTRSDELAKRDSNHSTITQKFHNVSELSYQAVMRELFPGDTRPAGARINYYSDQGLIIITLPGLPHELMANFDNAMMQSLVLQGFLWPGWGSQWLGSCRTARISLSHGRTLRKIEPDGGLQILSQTLPFLLVEVADSQEYGDVLKKASWVLRHSNGKIRFAVLIKLVGKSVKERREEMNRGKRVLSDMDEGPMDTIKRARTHGSNSLSSVGSPQPTSGCFESTGTSQHVPGSSPPAEIHSDSSDLSSVASANFTGDQYLGLPTANPPPTLAPDSDVDSATSSDATPATGDPSSPSSPTIPFNPRAAFSSAFVTVLGTTLTGTRRNVTTLLDCIEFWPRRPGPDDVFTFGWEDMPAPRFPDVMRGRTFKVGFEELHQTLDVFVKTGDPAWVREHGEEVLGEWEDGGSSETRGSGSGDEDDDEDEEEEEEEGGESDGEYCG